MALSPELTIDNNSSRDSEDNESSIQLVESKYNNQQHPNCNGRQGSAGMPLVSFTINQLDSSKKWFHHRADRDTAEKILEGKESGVFLIRPSSRHGCIATSFVVDGGTVEHNVIFQRYPGYSINPEDDTVFDNLQDLIQHLPHLKSGINAVQNIDSSRSIDASSHLSDPAQHLAFKKTLSVLSTPMTIHIQTHTHPFPPFCLLC